MPEKFPRSVEISKSVGSVLFLLVASISTSSTCLDYQSGGDPLLEVRWEDSATGGAIDHLEERARLETRFCLTQQMNWVAERGLCPITWSIPYFSLSLPVRGSTVGFSRSCLEDYNSISSGSSGLIVSSGAVWSNSVWWRHRLRGGVRLKLETGFLKGEIVKVRGRHPHLLLNRREVGGQMVGGSVSFHRNECETYGGIRRYFRSERSDEFWLGVQKVSGVREDGRMEIVYRPNPDTTQRTSQSVEFRFGAREKISEALWLRYGFSTLPSPFVVSFILGCGVYREIVSVNTTIRSSFSEDERVVQVWIGLSTRL